MSKQIFALDIDASELTAAPAALSRAYIAAGKRATRRTGQWARTQGTRAIAKAENIPQGILRKARRISLKRGMGPPTVAVTGFAASALAQTLWFGIRPIKAVYIGKPRQTRKGVSVRGRKFEGAFLATMKSGHLGIFERRDKARLPIDELSIDLKGAESALAGVRAQIPAHLQQVMRQELNYQLNVKGLK